jgi:ATP-binding cassette subfamily C protein
VAGRAHWVRELYERNRPGVLTALGFTVVAALVELASFTLYYPILALLVRTEPPAGPGAAVLGRVRETLGAEPPLALVLGMLVGLLIIRSGCLYVSRIVSNHYELQFNRALKREFLRRFTEAAWEFVVRARSGALLNTFSTYTTSASRALFYLVELLIDVVSCLAYLAFAVYTSPPLALFVLLAAAVTAPVLKRLYWRIRRLVQRSIAVQNELADKFLEYLRGFKTFKSMSREAFYVDKLQGDLDVYTDTERRSYRVQAALQAAGEPLFAVLGALFLLAAHYAFATGMETLVVFVVLLNRTYVRLNSLQANAGRLLRNAPALETWRDFDRLAAAAAEPAGGRPIEGRIATVELDRVAFAYPDGTRVLEDVSFTLNVERGLVAVVGPSGAGKSTLLDLLCGLVRPGAGAVRINGIDTRVLDLRALRARIGFVPQSPVLFDRSIAQNISLRELPETDLARVEAAARQADAHDFVTRLARGYDTVMGEAGASLSQGQIQRISIARALYQRPEILFCDEPTSALDARAAAEVMRVIAGISASYPVFLVTHSETVRRAAQTLLAVEGGGVTVRELTAGAAP